MANYKIFGSNNSYTGKAVQIGDSMYSTVGGALEGNSQMLEEDMSPPTQNNTRNRGPVETSNTDSNPITRTFTAPTEPRYYRPNGSIVPLGYNLHEHADGTIMTEHSMGRNDNSVVVSTDGSVSVENNERQGNMLTSIPAGNQTPPRNGMTISGNQAAPDTQTGGGSGGY